MEISSVHTILFFISIRNQHTSTHFEKPLLPFRTKDFRQPLTCFWNHFLEIADQTGKLCVLICPLSNGPTSIIFATSAQHMSSCSNDELIFSSIPSHVRHESSGSFSLISKVRVKFPPSPFWRHLVGRSTCISNASLQLSPQRDLSNC